MGSEQDHQQPGASTVVVRSRKGVVVALTDQALGREVAVRARGSGLAVKAANSVAEAAEAIRSFGDAQPPGSIGGLGALLVDASFGREAAPLVKAASDVGAASLVVGDAHTGDGVLRLLEAGARIYIPLPATAGHIAERLLETATRSGEGERGIVELAKAELQAVFDAFPSPLLVVDSALRLRRANRAALLLSGEAAFVEIIGRPVTDVFGWEADAGAALGQAVASGIDCECDIANGSIEQRCRVFAGHPMVIHGQRDFLVMIEDFARARMEELERARREKLEAVALLAATLSHEINQPLGAILGRAQLAQMGLEKPGDACTDIRRDLDEIVSCVHRISGILERLHQVTDIVTKTYPGGTRILDLDRSSGAYQTPVTSKKGDIA